ncbi:ATP-dependent DNA helicase RecG [Fulvitalea axinellae]|uniref:ATP-dependent DNA helicase RecG n=1 Tax=Fulvitalea axinellae TaxID=1182444 RepID=A0AAU9D011_9BACT|nr:ATP-dependent DNA helicase RecG [Fulvitalea axinellae]
MASILDAKIDVIKGAGPRKISLLNTELGIFTVGQLLRHFPYRYEDRTQVHTVATMSPEMDFVQLKGKFRRFETKGDGKKKRYIGYFDDGTGIIEATWFRGIHWISQKLAVGMPYLVCGKPQSFGSSMSIPHPEVEEQGATGTGKSSLAIHPVYPTTERMKTGTLDSKALSRLQSSAVEIIKNAVPDNLPEKMRTFFELMPRGEAIRQVHFPDTTAKLQAARLRLKFEELFFGQMKILRDKLERQGQTPGIVMERARLVKDFYEKHLPFELTGAQKRVTREVYADMKSGTQMNRLIQGDVGSGKTMVAFLCVLLAVSSGTQAALMVPTEILADQHFQGLGEFADKLGIRLALLTGSTRKRVRDKMLAELAAGELHLIVGTHALLEDRVMFKRLGLAIIDEQHRFGVAQRSKLWSKNKDIFPHVLVMTATPIPRTLAMTVYGDLDVSVIDEMPAGRKPIKTSHLTDASRLKIFSFMRSEIQKGRQVYIVYPLIEESSKADLKDLMDGYESVSRAFPDLPLSIVHGRMKPADKEYEMARFSKGETKIMVATTVIEVGVNVPNATVMVIENAERFGLAQLHQLRGRVGRGGEQSYCLLITKDKLSRDSKIRMETMVKTNNGFEIADTDLKLRGPGDMSGTRQSGVEDLRIADLAQDGNILRQARRAAKHILSKDPKLESEENQPIRSYLDQRNGGGITWGRIS